MRYNVAQLLREQVGSTRSYQIDEEPSPHGKTPPEQAENRLLLMRTDKGLWATARLETQVPGVCSRCLKPFTQSLAMVIEEEYFPMVDVNTGRPLPIPDQEQGVFTIDSSHILDLHEAVRQYSMTHGPMKPLCQPGCLGLCPTCGEDLNQGACSCQAATTDPRWAPLKQLLERGG